MTTTRRHLLPLIVLALLGVSAAPVQAARLVTIGGEARQQQVSQTKEFKLSELSAVNINYSVTQLHKTDCSVHVLIYRRQGDRWLVVSNVLRTSRTTSGTRTLKLSRGEYRIQVIATQARFNVTVDR